MRVAGSRVVAGAIGGALVVGAIAFTVVEPTDIQTNAPFVTMVTGLDHKVATREFDLTVTDVTLADRVTGGGWVGTTDGVWLVVDVTYAARLDSTALTGSMMIGGTDYRESQRVESADLSTAFSDPGLAWARSVVFELPRSALAAPDADHALIQFAASGDPRLDGVVQVPLDLTTLAHSTSLVIDAPGRVTR